MLTKDNHINFSLVLLLFVATALLYGHSLWNPLVFDDKPFFIESTLESFGSKLFHLDLRWFSYATFGWTYNLFGLDWFWYRVGNLCLHALTSAFLFIFFYRLLVINPAQTQASLLHPRWAAFFAALIFALHPMTVYGVAYLMERSIIMATLFGILSLICYLEGLSRNSAKWFIGSALFYFISVFSKEHSVMLPGVAVALTLLLHKPSLPLLKKIWLPFSLYLGIGVLITLRAKGVLGSPYEPYAQEMLARISEQQVSVHVESAYQLSVITEAYLFFKYLLLWVAPYTGWMSIDMRQAFPAQLLSWPELPGFILFLAYPVLALRLLLKGGRPGLVGLGMLFPWILYLTELATVRVQEPFVLYRSYLWMSGSSIVILALLGTLNKRVAIISMTALCLVLAALSWNRLDTFSSGLKLWTDVVANNQNEKLPGVERGYNNRGFAHMELEHLAEAQADFAKAIAINPKYAQPHLNMGIISFKQNNFDAALQSYNTVIALKPAYASAYLNRGALFLQNGKFAEALNDFDTVIKLNPRNADAYLNRSLIFSTLGKMQEAIHDLDEAIHLNPLSAKAYMNRATLDARLGHSESALYDLEKAAKISPDTPEIYFNRALIYGANKRYQEAMQDYNRVLALNPNHANAYVNRGGLYMIAKRWPEAIAEFTQAIRVNPDNENAFLNRANIYAGQARHQEALADYDQVLRLNPRNEQALANRKLMLRALNRK